MEFSSADPVSANRANWDDRVPVHLASEFYGIEDWVADPTAVSGVVAFDARRMAPHLPAHSVRGLTLAHLQCHIGQDTLSWARLGAHVTGIDFSPAAVAAARTLADRCALAARFVQSTVDDAPTACPEPFDVVYTSIGTVVWLSDLSRWAATIAALLRPGGLFYLRDGHPVLTAAEYERDDGQIVLTGSYFPSSTPERYDDGTTYTDGGTGLAHPSSFQWPHSLAEIVQCLLDAGLALTSLQEHSSVPWRALRWMVPGDNGEWVLPSHPERAPLGFSVTAVRPAPRPETAVRADPSAP